MNSNTTGTSQLKKDGPSLKNQLWFGYLVAAIVWAGCAYVHLGQFATQNDYFAMGTTADDVQTNDSVLFYASGQMARSSLADKSSLYDSAVFREKIDALISPIKTQNKVLLQYPPHFFLSLLPLPSFTIFGAWVYSSIFSAICLVLAIRNIVFPTESSKFVRAVMVALAFLWYPSYWCFRLGQNSIALLLGASVIWFLLQRKRWAAAGAVTAIGIFKVQYMPIMAVIGLMQGGKSYANGFALGGLAVLLLSACCFGPGNILAFPQSMLSGEHANGAGPHMMDTVRGALSIFPLPEKFVTVVSTLTLGAGILATAFLWHKVYPRLNGTGFPAAFELCGSISIILLMVTSLHSFIQDYAMLLIAGYWSYKVNCLVSAKEPTNKICKLSNIFLLTLPAVSWAYGYLAVFCFILKPMLWWSLTLLACNVTVLKRIERLFPASELNMAT